MGRILAKDVGNDSDYSEWEEEEEEEEENDEWLIFSSQHFSFSFSVEPNISRTSQKLLRKINLWNLQEFINSRKLNKRNFTIFSVH